MVVYIQSIAQKGLFICEWGCGRESWIEFWHCEPWGRAKGHLSERAQCSWVPPELGDQRYVNTVRQ